MKENLGPSSDPNQSKNEIPLTASPIVPDAITFRRRSMREALMGVTDPAASDLTTLATRLSAQASRKNKLATDRPPYILPGFDENYEYLYLIPLGKEVPGAVPVTYNGGRASLNLYVAFSHVNRLAPEGRREIYPLKLTPQMVTIGQVKGWGLYCELARVTSEPISTLSDEEKARRKATRERNKQKKNGEPGTAATGD